jgi:hypothetical protein
MTQEICECGHDKIRHGGLLKQMRITNKHTPCWDCPCKKFTPRNNHTPNGEEETKWKQ